MNLFKLFGRKPASAPVARERLQILLAHERKCARDSDLIAALQKDVLATISRHISINPDKVSIKMHQREENVSLLEIDIEIEDGAAKPDESSELAA